MARRLGRDRPAGAGAPGAAPRRRGGGLDRPLRRRRRHRAGAAVRRGPGRRARAAPGRGGPGGRLRRGDRSPGRLGGLRPGALGDVERAAGARRGRPGGDAGSHGVGATEALGILPALVEDPERHRALWARRGRRLRRVGAGPGRGMGHASRSVPSTTWPSSASTSPIPTRRGAAWGTAPAAPGRRAQRHRPCLRVATVAGGRRRGPLPLRVVGPAGQPPTPAAASTSAPAGRRAHRGRERPGAAGSSTVPAPSPGRCTWPTAARAPSIPSDVVDLVCAASRSSTPGPPAWDPYAVPAG